MKSAALHQWLERNYAHYHQPEYIGSDPLLFLYRYSDPLDQEIVGLIAASLAYGNVKTINASIERVLLVMGPSPRAYLQQTPEASIAGSFATFRHRWTNGVAIANLLLGMKRVIEHYGSLGEAFTHCVAGQDDIVPAIAAWVDVLAHGRTPVKKELLADPRGGSACKRLHLYFRWMVRKDAIDPGCWRGISPALLLMPIDTHIHQFARRAGMTRRPVADHRTVVEITRRFQALHPDDPLRYDFSITRFGMLEGWNHFRRAVLS